MTEKTNGTLTTEDAKAILLDDIKGKVTECRKEIQTVLDKHKCKLDVTVTLTSKQIIPKIEVIPK